MLQSLPMVAELIPMVNPGLSSIIPMANFVAEIVTIGAGGGWLAGKIGIRILEYSYIYEEDELQRMWVFAIQSGVVAMVLGVNYLLLR